MLDGVIPMFALGLVTSLHCVFMCGGLVVTCAVRSKEGATWQKRSIPHLAYQSTKIVTYALVAVVLGWLVSFTGGTDGFTGVRNWLLIAGGAYMVLLGLSMSERFKVLRRLSPRPPRALITALSRSRGRAVAEESAGRPTLATPLMLGVLTGFLPCTPLIAAQMTAASTGSPLRGAALMLAFGLGTAPLMMAFGVGASLLSGKLERRFQVLAAVAVVLFGLVMFDRGLTVLRSPVNSSTIVAGAARLFAGADHSAFARAADGVVEIPLQIRNTRYEPQSIVIPANEAVRLIVDRHEDHPCSDQLAIPAAGLLIDLEPNGITTVDVPPMKPGTYAMTCGMAMMSGSVVVVSE